MCSSFILRYFQEDFRDSDSLAEVLNNRRGRFDVQVIKQLIQGVFLIQ